MADLALLRADPAAFAAEARGARLADWQEEDLRALAGNEPMHCWTWTRQTGKSERIADAALWTAFRKRNSLSLMVSGGGELGARRLLATARRLAVNSSFLKDSVLDEQAGLLTLSNGSAVRAVSASETAVRGWSADALFADEAQLLSSDFLLSGALPTVAARPGAFILMAGTCGRSEGAFYDTCVQAEQGAEGVRYSRRVSSLVGGAEHTPWLSPTIVTQLERSMGALRADAELRCIWVSDGAYLFSARDLDLVTADFRADTLEGLHGPAGIFAGLDLGLVRDRCAFVGLGRLALPGNVPFFAVRTAHAWPSGTPLMTPEGGPVRGVFEELAASPMLLQAMHVDATGMQGGLLQALAPMMRARPTRLGGGARTPRSVAINPFAGPPSSDPYELAAVAMQRGSSAPSAHLAGVVFNLQMKQASYAAARILVERGQLLLPQSAVELRRELLTIRTSLSRTGIETFDAETGGFDDLPDALMLALWPYRRKDGQWRTTVSDFSERPAPLPVPVPGDTVRTGAGLEVPAVPAWASMSGHVSRELTLPDGAEEDLEREAREAREREQEALRERVRAAMTKEGAA
jgi:hypothetical protein